MFLGIPLVVLVIIKVTEEARTSSIYEENSISLNDIRYEYWHVAEGLGEVAWYDWITVVLSFLFVIIGLIEAIAYYFAMNFPYRSESILATVVGFKRFT